MQKQEVINKIGELYLNDIINKINYYYEKNKIFNRHDIKDVKSILSRLHHIKKGRMYSVISWLIKGKMIKSEMV